MKDQSHNFHLSVLAESLIKTLLDQKHSLNTALKITISNCYKKNNKKATNPNNTVMHNFKIQELQIQLKRLHQRNT